MYDRTDGPPPDPCATTVCTRVYRGNGDGTFTEIANINVANRSLLSNPPSAYEVVRGSKIADIDGDGLVDLTGVEARYSDSSRGWRSRGDGNFDAIATAGECRNAIDFNGDGRLDCLYTTTLGPSYNALQLIFSTWKERWRKSVFGTG